MKCLLVSLSVVLFAAYIEAACLDKYPHCQVFVQRGLCQSKPDYSKRHCAKTCRFCTPTPGSVPPPSGIPPIGECGKQQIKSSRVIAGTTAVRGSWPWQILMFFNGQMGCGGTIIGPRHVVTAAHCVAGRTQYPTYFTIRVGEHDTRETEGSEADYRVSRVFQHPRYNYPTRINNDIAVFELERPIVFNKYVQPACLPKKDVPVGTECYITGWGKIRHPGYMTHTLQQARLSVPSNDVCQKKNFPYIGIKVTQTMICGGDGGRSHKSGCHGDSGGPFVCEVNGQWELHGAVSHGSPRCSSYEAYTVFARVRFFKTWILSMMRQ